MVESGRFRATKGGAQVAAYDGAGSFGELALMYNCPRAATVTGRQQLAVVQGYQASLARACKGELALMYNCPRAATVTSGCRPAWPAHFALLPEICCRDVAGLPSRGCMAVLTARCRPCILAAALSDGVLWALDRGTFRALVVGSMAERAQRYQASLRRIPILQHLSQASPGGPACWWLTCAGGMGAVRRACS